MFYFRQLRAANCSYGIHDVEQSIRTTQQHTVRKNVVASAQTCYSKLAPLLKNFNVNRERG
jgi:hypothetical protein